MKIERKWHNLVCLANAAGMDPVAHAALILAATLLPVIFLWGCAGVVSGQNTKPQASPSPQTYSVSGAITPAIDGGGATVTLSGAVTTTTTADSAGNYTFSGLADGTYAVTPSRPGYTFSPTVQSVTVNAVNLAGVDFTAAVQQAHSVALSWTASTSTVSGYNVYRTTISGAQFTLVNSSLVTALAYTDTTVQSGTTYYYVTTAVDASGNESIYSNQVSAPIP
jgi:hypothetical protein